MGVDAEVMRLNKHIVSTTKMLSAVGVSP